MANGQGGRVAGKRSFGSIGEFYPFYLSQHTSRINRRFHFIGTAMVILLAAVAAVSGRPWVLVALPVAGYGLAWFGHFVFEKNKPATFQYPFFSLVCDFVMFRDMLRGRIKF
jgi:hypothetical protein